MENLTLAIICLVAALLVLLCSLSMKLMIKTTLVKLPNVEQNSDLFEFLKARANDLNKLIMSGFTFTALALFALTFVA